MKSSRGNSSPVDAPAVGSNEATGLPWFRTWRGVYALVLMTFILWVLLLLALTMHYS